MNPGLTSLDAIDLSTRPLIDLPNLEQRMQAGDFGRWSSHAWWLGNAGYCIVEINDRQFLADCDEVINFLRYQLAPALNDWEQGGMEVPRLQDAWNQHPAVQRLALQPVILDLLRSLYGREPFAFQTLNFAVGSQQTFHSDAVHFHSLPYGFMCGVWIPLADVELDSGPLLYYPYSHHLPYLSAGGLGLTPEQVGAEPHPQRFFEPYWQQLVQERRLREQHFLPKRGEILIWHANLLHGGTKVANRFTRRWSQVVHYFFADCLYTTPLQSFPPDQGGALFRNPYDIASGNTRWTRSEWANLDLTSQASIHQSFCTSG